jgi:hypothetical protein
MTDSQPLKRRIVHTVQRLVVNPVGRRLPLTMLETVGRKSGQPRRTGTAHLLPADDAKERLRSLPGVNSALVRLAGSDLLTIRVDLD